MSDRLLAKIHELEIIIADAKADIEVLANQISLEKSKEWVGRCFKVERRSFSMGERFAERSTSYNQIVALDHWYYGRQIEWIEYKDQEGGQVVGINSYAMVDPAWLAKNGEEISLAEFREEIEYLLRCTLPFRVELPPRPAVETMCPCPGCSKCCCGWVEGRDEAACVNFDGFGRCICEHAEGQAAITDEEYQEAVATDEEIEAEIKQYEQQFGMSSEEFLEQVRLGTAPDEAGIIGWKLLLEYR